MEPGIVGLPPPGSSPQAAIENPITAITAIVYKIPIPADFVHWSLLCKLQLELFTAASMPLHPCAIRAVVLFRIKHTPFFEVI
jgi:hypothetical protein